MGVGTTMTVGAGAGAGAAATAEAVSTGGGVMAMQSSSVSLARLAASVEQRSLAAARKLCIRANSRAVSRVSQPLSILPPPNVAANSGEEAPAE